MPDKLKYIPNDDTQNYPFSRLQSVIKTFEQVPKVKTTNKKRYKKPLGINLTNKRPDLLFSYCVHLEKFKFSA